MSDYQAVNIVKKANIYFDGKVTSRTIKLANGEMLTLGIILPGEYEFNTGKKEIMTMQAGSADVLLAGEKEWVSYQEGQQFEVPANSSFKIKTDGVVDYICEFVGN